MKATIEEIRKAFAENLKRLRSEAGLSQRELAKELDVSPSAIAMLERGKRTPSMMMAARTARRFSVDFADLFE